MAEQKPGQTIKPDDKSNTKPQPAEDATGHTNDDSGETDQAETYDKKSQPAAGWKFKNDAPTDSAATNRFHGVDIEPITWSASEFVAHEKSFGWYALLGMAAIVLAGAIFLLTHDKISTSVVIIVAIVFGFYAQRQPRTLEYKLDSSGLSIAAKFYSYDSFKSFAVIDEGAFSSITLMPLRRFMPTISIYYSPEDEKKIINVLAEQLPAEESKGDVVDNLMRRIRF